MLRHVTLEDSIVWIISFPCEMSNTILSPLDYGVLIITTSRGIFRYYGFENSINTLTSWTNFHMFGAFRFVYSRQSEAVCLLLIEWMFSKQQQLLFIQISRYYTWPVARLYQLTK